MNETWKTSLKDSISEVFGTSFFLVPEPAPELLDDYLGLPAAGWLEGSLTVSHGQQKATFWIWAPMDVGRELAANIYAMETSDVDEAQVVDAYAEMMNMVAGGLLTKVDDQGVWEMGLPQAAALTAGPVGQRTKQAAGVMAFEVGSRPLISGWSG